MSKVNNRLIRTAEITLSTIDTKRINEISAGVEAIG